MWRIAWILFFGVEHFALSQTLYCNRAQNLCELSTRDLSIGDRVVIMSDDKELVARGVVKAIDGMKRKISITERYVPIQSDHTVLPVDPENEPTIAKLQVPRGISKYFVGGDAMIGSFMVGSGLLTIGGRAFGYMRNEFGFDYVGRASLLSMSGSVTRTYSDKPTQTSPFSGTLFTVAAGAGQTFLRRKALSFHMDAVLGFGYLSAAVDGNPSDVDGAGYTTRVKNGIGFHIEGNGQAMYRFGGDWAATAGVAAFYYPNALGAGGTVGVGKFF